MKSGEHPKNLRSNVIPYGVPGSLNPYTLKKDATIVVRSGRLRELRDFQLRAKIEEARLLVTTFREPHSVFETEEETFLYCRIIGDTVINRTLFVATVVPEGLAAEDWVETSCHPDRPDSPSMWVPRIKRQIYPK